MQVKYNENWHEALNKNYEQLKAYGLIEHADVLLDFKMKFFDFAHTYNEGAKEHYKCNMIQDYGKLTYLYLSKPMTAPQDVEAFTYVAYVLNFLETILTHV